MVSLDSEYNERTLIVDPPGVTSAGE
jgi:hypothetical protein